MVLVVSHTSHVAHVHSIITYLLVVVIPPVIHSMHVIISSWIHSHIVYVIPSWIHSVLIIHLPHVSTSHHSIIIISHMSSITWVSLEPVVLILVSICLGHDITFITNEFSIIRIIFISVFSLYLSYCISLVISFMFKILVVLFFVSFILVILLLDLVLIGILFFITFILPLLTFILFLLLLFI